MSQHPWPTRSLGDLFDIGAGKSVTPQSRLTEPKHPFLRTANVFWGKIELATLDAMHFSKEEIEAKSLKKGDLLVCEGGDIGRSAIWNGEVSECSFQNHIHRLRAKTNETVPRFVMYFLQAGFTQLGIYEGAGNKTTIPNLSRSRLAALHVPMPPKPEQEKVAAFLWKVQRAIEVQDKLAATARELKQSAMRQLFTHGLRGESSKETDIGPAPSSWQPKRIHDFGEVVTGTTPPTATREYYDGGEIPFISPGDLGADTFIRKTGKKITEAGLNESRALPRNTVCCVCIGSTIGKVGITVASTSATNQQINAIIVKAANDPLFVSYLLQFKSEHIASFSSPSPVPIMSKGIFANVALYVSPDKKEQSEIAAILQTIDRKISLHERKRTALSDLFHTLLHQLMTARIRVSRLDIDTSEVEP